MLNDLQRLVAALENDLRAVVDADAAASAGLRAAWNSAREASRTGDAFSTWLDGYLTQIAVAWVLTLVFVRYLEDRRLVPPRVSGPDRRARDEADDARRAYFERYPTHADTDYLLSLIGELAALPAGELFGERRNPLHRLRPSPDGGRRLLKAFADISPETGLPAFTFTDEASTRFLGDLYQDLSEAARKRYALLQTPVFVESFILDLTLTPALSEFGVDGLRLIDPACGSGHFLLGGFARILAALEAAHPGRERRQLVAAALEAVNGVDLNPFAVEIARFRLLVAALSELEPGRVVPLAEAPALPLNVAVGDSLIHGVRHLRFDTSTSGKARQLHLDRFRWEPERFGTEDNDLIAKILGRQYHVVVGNPPYITVKDATLRDVYRDQYASAAGKYALVCPFFERFVELALHPADEGLLFASVEGPVGYFGMIVANSFMKREFGKKLVEEVVPNVDLTHVLDTSGAYIPGHGTPTVILAGRNRAPVAEQVHAVLGIRGEPSTPDEAAEGVVWTAIAANGARGKYEDEYISAGPLDRELLHSHPWSLQGGGALQIKEVVEAETDALGGHVQHIGITAVTGEDDLYVLADVAHARRIGVPVRPLVTGDLVRDWAVEPPAPSVWCYDEGFEVEPHDSKTPPGRYLWLGRTGLSRRKRFGTPMLERGLTWHEWQELYTDKLRSPLSITFAFVSTHNHFALDRGGKVFNRSAPVIKLPPDASEADHLGLLGLLNSSTACFWMKQVFHDKGIRGEGGGLTADTWERFYEFDSTKTKQFPLPSSRPLPIATELDALASRLSALSPASLAATRTPTAGLLDSAESESEAIFGRMMALQEELDWQCYGLYGLLDAPPLSADLAAVPEVRLGERAFEIVLARKVAAGEVETAWFERHGSTPVTEVPSRWPAWYRDVVEARIACIASSRAVGLIEQPEYKRRWSRTPWSEQEKAALRTWLLDRLESQAYVPQAPGSIAASPTAAPSGADGPASGSPAADGTGLVGRAAPTWGERDPAAYETARLVKVSELGDLARADADFVAVAQRYSGDIDVDVSKLVATLVLEESVPHLPSQRYKPSGLRKRAEWEQVWALQRLEDAIAARTELPESHAEHLSAEAAATLRAEQVGTIAVPPKYGSGDFRKAQYWRLRGKLDVPKERWVHYPGAEDSTDGSAVVSWAGLDAYQQAKALAEFYLSRSGAEGWGEEKLVPLLAGLKQLEPWVRQWHPEPDPYSGVAFADTLKELGDAEARQFGLTWESLPD